MPILKYILLAVLWVSVVSSQTDMERIEDFIREVMEADQVPGLSIAVVKDGEPFLVRGFGVKDLENMEPVNEDTLFLLASTTKHMTGTLLVQQMAQNGSYTLESPVKEILGDNFYLSDYYRTINLNSRDTMAHRLNTPMSNFHIIMGSVTDRTEYIRRTQYWEALAQFRSEYQYSNTMTTVAGITAGLLSEEGNYEEAMLNNLFEPLEMYSTTFTHILSEEQLENLATPHITGFVSGQIGSVALEAYGGAKADAPAGGGVSSANDLAKWLKFQLSNGRGPSDEILVGEDVLEQIKRAHFMTGRPFTKLDYKPALPVNYAEETYGLGLGLGSYREYRMVQHGGAFFGFWANIMMLPDIGMGVFICVNGPDSSRASDAMKKIKLFTMDIMLGFEPWINSTFPFPQNELFMSESDWLMTDNFQKESAIVSKAIEEMDTSSLSNVMELIDYEGMYGHFAMGNISIVYISDTDTLMAFFGELGTFRLELFNDVDDPLLHTFIAYFEEPWWFMSPVRVFFQIDEITELPKAITVPIMLPGYPPSFIKDLDIANAPDPDECS